MADPIYRLNKKGRGSVPLFHTTCGALLCHIKNADFTQVYDQLLTVTAHLVKQRHKCPRCHLFLDNPADIVPSLDSQFIPVGRQDESGLVGFGPEFGDPTLTPLS